jgi:methionine-rich copper-binding protein CopC
MRLMSVALAWLLLVFSSSACAHAHLKVSSPAAGSRLRVAPAVLSLEFSEAAQLTALSIEKTGAQPVKLSAPQSPQTHISVPLPTLTPGTYVVRFRALGSDGHLVPGEFTFSLAP